MSNEAPIDELRVGIKRLMAELRSCDQQAQQFRAEIARLRAALETIQRDAPEFIRAYARRALEG
jgi:prefoldin subunit 5